MENSLLSQKYSSQGVTHERPTYGRNIASYSNVDSYNAQQDSSAHKSYNSRVQPPTDQDAAYADQHIQRNNYNRGTSNKERLPQDINNNRLYGSQTRPIVTTVTPGQKDRNDRTAYESYGNSLPTRDRSPYQGVGSSGFNNSNNNIVDGRSNNASSDDISNQVKQHMSKLQNDNASLLRRLSLVVQELDRVQKEKEDLYEKSAILAEETSQMEQLIDLDNNVDKANRHVDRDIKIEKDKAQAMKQNIKELEVLKSEILIKLRRNEVKQNDSSAQNSSFQMELQNKLTHISEIEKEQYYTSDKIKQVNSIMEKLRLQCHQDSQQKLDLQVVIDELRIERNDLLNRLDNLTSKYDECVRDIAQSRDEMEFNNNKHKKLVSAKILFQELEAVMKSKQRQSISDLRNYCEFDSKCQKQLGALAKIMSNCGRYRLKTSIIQWYSNALKPVKSMQQSMELSNQSYIINLKQKMFYNWRKVYNSKIDAYSAKTQAIKQIWQFYQNDSEVELKRSFTIWRDLMKKGDLQKQKVKKLVWRLYFNKLSASMSQWSTYSSQIDSQVRLNLLAQNFSQKQYLTLVFNNFKYQVIDNKRKKQNRLFHAMKAWQDYIRHKKYLMGAGLAGLHFNKQQKINLIMQCFDAMRQHKEQSKYEKVHTELFTEILPQIDGLNQDINVRSQANDSNQQALACKYVKTMLSKQIFGYFRQWKQVNEDYKNKLRTTVKDKVMKLYLDQLRKGFTLWHVNSDGLKLNKQECHIQEMQQEQAELTEDVVSLQKDVKEKKQQLDQSQNKRLHKCAISFQRRMKQLAMGRWKDNVNGKNLKEEGAESIIKKMRTRYLRQAFDLYKRGSDYKKKLQIEEERCIYFNNTRNERLKKRVYNAWHIYRNNFSTAKACLERMYTKLDLVLKQRAVRTWKEQAQAMLESQLQVVQNEIVSKIDETNQELGHLHTQEQNQQSENKVVKEQMVKQAQRVLANAYVKCYYVSHSRGFEKWKEFVTAEKRKEVLIKKMINHMRMYQFQNVKTKFQQWMAGCDIEVKQDQLKKETQRLQDLQLQYTNQVSGQQQVKLKLDSELNEISKLQQNYNTKYQKSIQMVVNKIDGNHYMSQKRFIIQQWRDYVKREKHFISCVQNVIKKSLWQKGFQEIRAFSRVEAKQNKVETVLEKFRLKFWKRTCSSAFSQWKSGAYQSVLQDIEECEEQTNALVEEHQNKIVIIKEQNAVKSAKMIGSNNLRKLFANWKQTTKQQKLIRMKQLGHQDRAVEFQKRQALLKWAARIKATKIAKVRIERLRTKFMGIRKMMVFNGMKSVFGASKDFMTRMSNLANIHDQQALKMGYNSIISFAKAKNYVYQKKQEHAAKDFKSILSSLLTRKMTGYFNDLKHKGAIQNKQNLHKFYTILHNSGNKMRAYFQQWKQEVSYRQVVEEIDEDGHVRNEWFEQRNVLENCKRFMESEGYSQKDIQQALKQGSQQQNGVLLKAVRRIQHFNEPLGCKPRMFDRWKQYVHMRKLFKYWLSFVDQRSTHVQSDMAKFFNKWKNYDQTQKAALTRLTKDQLDTKMIRNDDELNNLADSIQLKDDTVQHLKVQQGDLLDRYVKGQKLALSLLNNSHKRSMHRAFLRWSKKADNVKQNSMEEQLKKKLEMITALKDRMNALESANDTLASENEEFRQFSLDGYEIAKNVQALSLERERLSVDLADKAQLIRRLLDENESLSHQLRKSQQVGKSMMQSTGNRYMQSASTKAGLSFSSPMPRHYQQ